MEVLPSTRRDGRVLGLRKERPDSLFEDLLEHGPERDIRI